MEELLLNEIKVGQTVKGEVISLTENMAAINLQQFTEGTIYVNEYEPGLASFKGVLNVGDMVEAVVKKVDEEHGKILLSRLPLLKQKVDDQMRQASDKREVIKLKVEKNIGFGLVGTYLNNQVFIPAKDVDMNPEFDANSLVGQTIEVKLGEFDDRRKRYVASRKTLQIALERQNRQEELANIVEGDVLEGVVSKIDNFGVFVRFNYNQGLIRYRELSHIPFNKPEDILKVGEKVTVKVIKVDGNRIDLSRKALLETPYQEFVKDHKVSDVIEGEIVQKLPIGAIVKVAPHVTALLHQNEISWNPNDNTFASLKIGQTVKAAIIGIDKKKERISLSMKTLTDNPWAKVKAQVGETVTVEITNIVPGRHLEVSAFGVTGIIPQNEVTFTGKDTKSSKLEDYYAVGDKVTAVVTFVDVRQWRLELSIKKHTSRVEREQFEEYMKKEQENETPITLGDLFANIK